jgi:hypothetical protein
VRILYLTHAVPDYLSDDLLYGLRALLGADVVDYPRKDVLYRSSPLRPLANALYGAGFHCFGLDDTVVDRSDLAAKVAGGHFDMILNSSAWRIACPLHPRLGVIDGEDRPALHSRYLGRVPLYWKRELLQPRADVEPILFALPDFLDDATVLPRVKAHHASFRMTSGIRRELAAAFPPQYTFSSWREYQRDIKQSWFAISPRGGGYDCQRHYEILGQAVLCLFVDAQAPWLMRESFRDGDNCLTFASVAELQAKIAACTDPQRLIDRGRADLERRHLASRRARDVLDAVTRRGLPARPPSWRERLTWRLWLRRSRRRLAHFRPPRASHTRMEGGPPSTAARRRQDSSEAQPQPRWSRLHLTQRTPARCG